MGRPTLGGDRASRHRQFDDIRRSSTSGYGKDLKELLKELERLGKTWKDVLMIVDGSFFTASTDTNLLFFLHTMKLNKAMQQDTCFRSFSMPVASKALSLAGT